MSIKIKEPEHVSDSTQRKSLQTADIPKIMKAVLYYNNHDVRLVERPVPEISPGELLVKMEACGLCGSELTEYYMVPRAPLVMGHEPTGVVVRVGEGVTKFKLGDRVYVHHHVGCMSCHQCQRGNFSLCENFRKTFIDPGGMCEYFRVPAPNVQFDTLILPDNVTFDQGSLVEPIACTMRGVKITPIRPGDTVIIIGMGFIGLSYLELIRHMPAGKIIVLDLNEWRLQQGLRHGATHGVNPGEVDPIEKVNEINEGRLGDAVFVAVPSIRVWDQGLSLTEKGGTIHFGTPLPPDVAWPINPNKLWFSEIKLNFTYSTTHIETSAVLDMIAAGRLEIDSLITHRFGLDRVPEAIKLYKDAGESLKQLIKPSLTQS
jgi:L-iditol 2-dehydrogenase